jgi:hypothetical protein
MEFHKLMLNLGDVVEIHYINLKSGIIFGQNFINFFESIKIWFIFGKFNLI